MGPVPAVINGLSQPTNDSQIARWSILYPTQTWYIAISAASAPIFCKSFGGFHGHVGTQKWTVYNGTSQSRIDDNQGCPHFRKPPYGGFLKQGYPQITQFLQGFSLVKHPAIGIPPFRETSNCHGWHGLHRSNGPASTGQESGISQDFTMENMWISLGVLSF